MDAELPTNSNTGIDSEADAIVARHIEARGGMERILAITTLRQSGRVKMGQEGNAWLSLYGERKRPEMLRIEFSLNGAKGVEGWDGERAWEHNPWKNMQQAEYVTGLPAEALHRGAEFDGPLVAYREKGHIIRYIGQEELEGREVHHLEITRNDSNVIHYYLDGETMLTTKTVSVRPVHGSDPTETVTLYEEHRPVEGVLYPFQSRELARDGQHWELFVWDSIEANVPLDDSRFQLPK